MVVAMGFGRLLMQLVLVGVLVAPAAAQDDRPNCPQRCGNVSIPYPFGIKGCCRNEDFLITCKKIDSNSPQPQPFLGNTGIEVTNINITLGELQINNNVSKYCYNSDYSSTRDYQTRFTRTLTLSNFTVSRSRNKFTVVGCNSYAYLHGFGRKENYSTGCMSICDSPHNVYVKSCAGSGCCQIEIPDGLYSANVTAYRFNERENVSKFNPCTYAFIVEDGKFNFSSKYVENIPQDKFPMVLEWSIHDYTNQEASEGISSACKLNAFSYKPDSVPGYRCKCNEGYVGNPYLGCQDVNECEDPSLNKCVVSKNCVNTEGNYTCLCPKGYRRDGLRERGTGCTAEDKQSLKTKAIIGSSIAISLLFVIMACALCGIQRRKINELKQKNFRDNGGPVLRQLLSKIERSTEKAKIFTEDELKKATNNFNESEIVGRGGFGIVYKGTLNNKLVAIKKSRVMDHDQIEQFVNEVFVLSQIKHPNVVKLIGCCLETSVPLLVYEFITNKTLHHHIQNEVSGSSMPWKTRLKIAVETADALAHMHSDAPIHIIHRDVKSENILLNDDFQAKVSDFGVSRLVPLDQTQLPTLVQGTFGYIDPEYFHSGLLNEKSDVYSFGVVLLELLTGEKVLSSDRPDKDKSLAAFFISSMKEDRLFEILHERVRNEGNQEQIKGVAELARRCLRFKGVKRPTMKEVKMELEELMIGKCLHVEVRTDFEETEPLLGPPTNFCSTSVSIGPDSTKYQAALQLESGR